MPKWFKATYTYTDPIDDTMVGTRNQEFMKTQSKTEQILIDAVSYTDAEARAFQEIGSRPDVSVPGIIPQSYADVMRHETGEDWYQAKVDFISEDEKTGKQKRTKSKMLLNAESFRQAYDRLELSLKTSLDPFEITDLSKTKILDVIEYTESL